MSFNWTLTDYGNLGAPQAYFYVGSTIYDLQGPGGTLWNIAVSPNTPIYFELVGDVSPGKSPAELGILEVPEPVNVALGVFAGLLLAVTGLRKWRRSSRTAIIPYPIKFR